MPWTKVSEITTLAQLEENKRLTAESSAGKARRAGGVVGSAARIVSADPFEAYYQVEVLKVREEIRQKYLVEHPEAALPKELQNKTAAELQSYIAAQRELLNSYEKAVAPMQARDDKAAADKAAHIKEVADAALAEAVIEAKRVKDIEDANKVMQAEADKRNGKH